MKVYISYCLNAGITVFADEQTIKNNSSSSQQASLRNLCVRFVGKNKKATFDKFFFNMTPEEKN